MAKNQSRLLKRARRFDQQALSEIYDRYSGPLFDYAVRRVGSPQLAEDLVAETFQRFLEALQKGGGPEEYLQAYLYRITHNLITDHYRREPPPPLQLDEERLHQKERGPKEIVADRFQAEKLRRALQLLTPGQQQVIVLKYLQGFSNQEVAQTMEKSVGAIKAQAHRGLASLERILLEEEDSLLEQPPKEDSVKDS